MSYDKNIENYTVKFKDEISYLNCRIDYLGHCRFVVTAVLSFIQFIQGEMYEKNKCEVESIGPIEYPDAMMVSTSGYVGGIDYTTGSDTITIQVGENFNNSENFEISSWTGLPATLTHSADLPKEIIKKEPPDDSIESRFDILDL